MNNQELIKPSKNTDKTLRMLSGIILAIFSLFIIISLFTYNPKDPGWGVSSSYNSTNYFGYPGSYISGLILKEFGFFTGLLISILFFFLSIKIIKRQEIQFILYKLFAFILLIFLSGLLSQAINLSLNKFSNDFQHFFLGVGISSSLYEKLVSFASDLLSISILYSSLIINIILMLINFILFIWILSFDRSDLRLLTTILRPIYIPIYWLSILINNLLFKDYNILNEGIEYSINEKENFSNKFISPIRYFFFRRRIKNKSLVRKDPVLIRTNEDDVTRIQNVKNQKSKFKQTRLNLSSDTGFNLPSIDLLQNLKNINKPPDKDTLDSNARLLENVLSDFSINGSIDEVRYGPVVTRYDLEPAPGLRSQRVISLADDIARSMAAESVRVAMVPGQNVIGIELPNQNRETVVLRNILEDDEFQNSKFKLPICLGKNIAGSAEVVDLSTMPHLLVAGTTGSGKSVGVNAMILSLLYKHTPDTCKFIMIDPKMLELSVYDGIPHLLTPVVTDPTKAIIALKWAVREMESRYLSMSKLGVRNIEGYNDRLLKARQTGEILTKNIQVGFDTETGQPVYEEQEIGMDLLPFIVVVIDEVADLMLVAGKEIEAAVQRLAQMARAAGIHVIMATQRPSVDVITGTIKANFPTRISFQVTSKIDSRTILGEQGAEQLLGKGDMLYMAGGGKVTRVHGPFVDDQEVEKVSQFLSNQSQPDYDESITQEPESNENILDKSSFNTSNNYDDEIYEKAVKLVIQERKASTSFIQRHLRIGYNRAATIIEKMEENNIISKPGRAGKREILLEDN